MELSVGLMLILLGIVNLTGIMRWIGETVTPSTSAQDSHPHEHGGYVHGHPHVHSPEKHGHAEDATPVGWMDRTFGRLGVDQIVRPLAVGIVHGLAGSAAVALLVLTTIRAPFAAVVYLLVFGIGTVAGMMLITAAMAVPFTLPECPSKPRPRGGKRSYHSVLRSLRRLPNGFRQRAVLPQSHLGASLTYQDPCRGRKAFPFLATKVYKAALAGSSRSDRRTTNHFPHIHSERFA